MQFLVSVLGGLTLVALSTVAAGLHDSELTRVVTIGDRTGPAFYSRIEGRYLFLGTTGEEVAGLPE